MSKLFTATNYTLLATKYITSLTQNYSKRRSTFTQEVQLSPRNRAMRRLSCNIANCHATVQKLLVRQVLNQLSAVANRLARQNRAVCNAIP